VLVASALGILLGHFYPEAGAKMKPLGDGFIKLIKMLIAPVIFCTVVKGRAAKWSGELDVAKLNRELAGTAPAARPELGASH
jgi:aerobic C4-dicarboxylate transport protein